MTTSKPKPAKTGNDVTNMPLPDKLRIYAESGGMCSYPGCERILVEDETGQTINSGQIAHIRGRKKNAARHDSKYIIDLDKYENTILMCYEHHHLIDSLETRAKYPLQVVLDMKAEASKKFGDFARLATGAPSFELLDELCTAIAGKMIEPDTNFDTKALSEKIRINLLSPDLALAIKRDLAQRGQVTSYLSIKSVTDSGFSQRLQATIKARYFDLVASGSHTKETIYKLIVGIVRGKNVSVDATNAAQIITAYFFEVCDILEKS